ncbi:hypothetical protein GCM10011399_34810 [Subtercola lobariae]|uniref:Uncharacterized protein n=1 Tax=Subtercola lobariae TaxID=1588641 RepID=A0A917BFW9_9MICO|nr:hypothetical protein GCM10011399_34810 [Subtercola lobariae]
MVLGMAATALSYQRRELRNHVVTFDLEVRFPGKQPYQMRTNQALPGLLVGGILPGSTVFVRVDRNNEQRVAIDFNQIIPNNVFAGWWTGRCHSWASDVWGCAPRDRNRGQRSGAADVQRG